MSNSNNYKIILFYDGECITCNQYLVWISYLKLPDQLKFAPINSKYYQEVLKKATYLNKIDSIVTVEYTNEEIQYIRFKADAITWLILKCHLIFLPLRVCYKLAPTISNRLYDLIAKYRNKTKNGSCPLPPYSIRKRILA